MLVSVDVNCDGGVGKAIVAMAVEAVSVARTDSSSNPIRSDLITRAVAVVVSGVMVV